jgi:hypothetical protein
MALSGETNNHYDGVVDGVASWMVFIFNKKRAQNNTNHIL